MFDPPPILPPPDFGRMDYLREKAPVGLGKGCENKERGREEGIRGIKCAREKIKKIGKPHRRPKGPTKIPLPPLGVLNTLIAPKKEEAMYLNLGIRFSNGEIKRVEYLVDTGSEIHLINPRVVPRSCWTRQLTNIT